MLNILIINSIMRKEKYLTAMHPWSLRFINPEDENQYRAAKLESTKGTAKVFLILLLLFGIVSHSIEVWVNLSDEVNDFTDVFDVVVVTLAIILEIAFYCYEKLACFRGSILTLGLCSVLLLNPYCYNVPHIMPSSAIIM